MMTAFEDQHPQAKARLRMHAESGVLLHSQQSSCKVCFSPSLEGVLQP